MWHTKYASAVPKNLGVGVSFSPSGESYFLSVRPYSVVHAARESLDDAKPARIGIVTFGILSSIFFKEAFFFLSLTSFRININYRDFH